MTGPPVIADAGPLIGLARIGLLPLLQKLYGTAVIPLRVLEELRTAEGRPGSEALAQALASGWLQPEAVLHTEELEALLLALGPGETEAIVLAQQRPCRFLVPGLRLPDDASFFDLPPWTPEARKPESLKRP